MHKKFLSNNLEINEESVDNRIFTCKILRNDQASTKRGVLHSIVTVDNSLGVVRPSYTILHIALIYSYILRDINNNITGRSLIVVNTNWGQLILSHTTTRDFYLIGIQWMETETVYYGHHILKAEYSTCAAIGPSGGVGIEVKQNIDVTEAYVDSLCVNSHNVEELRDIRFPAKQQLDGMWRLR
uniref:CNH domain-containing protein n=1 Tax=Heterorhabditis bacteriophora TaxID=37862 RepID=A0A1I7W6A4_HETBA